MGLSDSILENHGSAGTTLFSDSVFANYGDRFHFNHETTRGNLGIQRMHPQYEVLMCVAEAESAQIYINGKMCAGTQSFLLFLSPFTLHGVDLTFHHATTERYIYHFGNQFVDENPDVRSAIDSRLGNVIATVFLLENDYLQKCRAIAALSNSYEERDPAQRLLFLLLFHTIVNSDCKRIEIGTDKNYRLVQQILYYMQEHYSEPIDANTVAHNFYISRSKLDKDIRKHTGHSFCQLLNELRLCNAEYMLRNPNLKISDIAARCGFENENYFYTLFKNYKGTTPLKYQKNRKLHYQKIKK